jgi:alkane 1-monooxygenase
MFKYVKYSLFHLLGIQAALFVILGGEYMVVGLAFSVVFIVAGDIVLGDDKSTPEYQYPKLLTWQLWMALPLLLLIVFSITWQFAEHDLFLFGAWVENSFGIQVLEHRGNANLVEAISGVLLTGFFIGMIGTITAHELVHRTNDKISLTIGRWLLAFSFDSSFSIEHVYGHHRYVSTNIDPATAPRGRNVYTHILLSTIRGNVSAWRIEKAKLAKKRVAFLSIKNRLLRGYLMSIVLLIAIQYIGGTASLIAFIGAGIWGKCLLEIVNYMEHYGLVRDPSTSVQPRHSWNSNNRISSWAMFNLTRHSHHHAKGALPFHQLTPMADSPKMISGYLGTILVALLPPLWYKLMQPKLDDWDNRYASEREKEMLSNR